MSRTILISATVSVGLALGACSAEQDAASQSANATEGPLGFAPAITYGDTVSGQVASPQLNVWALEVQAGDRFRITKTVTSGDLAPDLVLYPGLEGASTPSTDYQVTDTTLTKDYEVGFTGRNYIVVRGYQNEGAGSYALAVECLAGPCAGELPPPPVVELDEEERWSCVEAARRCAIDALPTYNGYVGTVRAQQIFDDCLSSGTVETASSDVPATCAPACQADDWSAVCEDIVGLLPWLADQTPQCVDRFNECVDECYYAGTYSAYYGDYPIRGEAVCVAGHGTNGSCKDVEKLEACGGQWPEHSCEACYYRCEAHAGAWIDDLDSTCAETCECVPDWFHM